MKLYLLQLGSIEPLRLPVLGYLIETDEGERILVDTGIPRDAAAEHQRISRGLTLAVRPEDDLERRLATVGLRPADIDLVVCSHFDVDHSGGHDLFPQAEFVVQRRHYEWARAGHPRASTTRPQWDAPQLRYRLVDGDVTLRPGVELLETSGHVPGHQSALVWLPQTGPVLLAIDAVPAASLTDPETRTIYGSDLDEAETRASTRKLAEIGEREGVALTVYGHDPRQWATLRQAPLWYD